MHPSSLLFAIALACTAVLTQASALPAEDIALTPRDASPLADELDKRQCTPGLAQIGAGRTFTSAIREGDVVVMVIGIVVRGALVVREPSFNG
ncbi:uncharacterized protein H6S33_001465 [Morchella sextelata]|uniref:uncharacterized protein n=1 Tax=Morchella sextelata TaxID=1174677 RepID=UPI001D04CBE8|nr:uncharacterized protein H6S33_001465 [Morchella sextelata]KAH0608331.1 hypothetical protein H6S33_001465 [Morchella sextelata]